MRVYPQLQWTSFLWDTRFLMNVTVWMLMNVTVIDSSQLVSALLLLELPPSHKRDLSLRSEPGNTVKKNNPRVQTLCHYDTSCIIYEIPTAEWGCFSKESSVCRCVCLTRNWYWYWKIILNRYTEKELSDQSDTSLELLVTRTSESDRDKNVGESIISCTDSTVSVPNTAKKSYYMFNSR